MDTHKINRIHIIITAIGQRRKSLFFLLLVFCVVDLKSRKFHERNPKLARKIIIKDIKVPRSL